MTSDGYTFYDSYFRAIQRIDDPLERLAAYEALSKYAFTGEYTDLNGMAGLVLDMAIPTIETSTANRERAKKAKESKKEVVSIEQSKEISIEKSKEISIEKSKEQSKEKKIKEKKNNVKEREEKGSEEGEAAQGGEDEEAAPDINEIVDKWNKLPAPIPKVKSLEGDRKKLLKARIREHGTAEVIAAIEQVARSDFLQGKNDRGWNINFDWFIKPNNFQKVHEGNYTEDKQDDNTSTSTDDPFELYYAGAYKVSDAVPGDGGGT